MLSTLAITVSPFNLWKPQIFFQIVLQGKRSNRKCPSSELGCPYFSFPPPRSQWLAGPKQPGPGGQSHCLTLKGLVTKKPRFFPLAFLFFLLSQCSRSLLSAPSQPVRSTSSVRTKNAQSGLFICYQDGWPCWEAAFHNCQGRGTLLLHSSYLSAEQLNSTARCSLRSIVGYAVIIRITSR